jgi:hypothetical protein
MRYRRKIKFGYLKTGLIMKAALMGTLAWADKTGGRLSVDEKVALARNLASLRAETVIDEVRYRNGLLRPARIELDTLTPPDTKLARDADEFARSVYSDVLCAHCLRTYYFGAQVAAFDGIKFDREVFYAAAICHDVGINEGVAGPVGACCFAHSGGRLTCETLSGKGHGESAVRVGDAISTHMNLVVPPDQYPSESTLVAVGATCDIFGTYVRRIELTTLAATVERAPAYLRRSDRFLPSHIWKTAGPRSSCKWAHSTATGRIRSRAYSRASDQPASTTKPGKTSARIPLNGGTSINLRPFQKVIQCRKNPSRTPMPRPAQSSIVSRSRTY